MQYPIENRYLISVCGLLFCENSKVGYWEIFQHEMHGRLVVGAGATLATFLMETFEMYQTSRGI